MGNQNQRNSQISVQVEPIIHNGQTQAKLNSEIGQPRVPARLRSHHSWQSLNLSSMIAWVNRVSFVEKNNSKICIDFNIEASTHCLVARTFSSAFCIPRLGSAS